MTPAVRAREYRLRQKLGRRVFRLVLDEFAVIQAVLDAGRLSEEEALDHAAVETALAAVLESWARNSRK
jgi:hypothetical protein